MDNLSVIDRFTDVFSRYIDTGFGLLHGEVAFLTATLIVIDMTLAGLFWALNREEVIAKLIYKTLYVGTFAYIITNFNALSGIVFRSFAGLGLTATGSGLTQAQLLQPGHIASVGVDAAHPLMAQIGQLAGFPDVFLNLDTIVVLFLGWLIVLLSFFLLAVQLFVTLIEFKLTTLAGFVLVPFALWNKTAFLAERVLGNVISSGIKVLVLAVIVGIGGGIFTEFNLPAGTDATLNSALAMMLGAMALLGLGIFGPAIATGLVSGAPQLGAGAAVGTALAATGAAVAVGSVGVAAGRAAGGVATSAVGSATTLAGSARRAYQAAAASSEAEGAARVGAGLAGVARSAAKAAGEKVRSFTSRTSTTAESAVAEEPPAWAQDLSRRQQTERAITTASHTIHQADKGGSGANPSLESEE